MLQLGKQDCEFVAAQASNDVLFSEDGTQPLGNFDQEIVTARMADRVINLLEIVEVEEKNGEPLEALVLSLGALDELTEEFSPTASIDERGKLVVVSQISEAFPSLNSFGQIDVLQLLVDAGQAGVD